MSIRQKREPIIKPAPQHKFDAVAFASKKLAENEERCKCIDGVNSNSWESHGKYCPIWKNGRIEELEDFLNHVVYLKEEDYDYAKDDHMIIRNIIPRIKELINK